MDDVSFEFLHDRTRRFDCACLEVAAETPCNFLGCLDGTRIVAVYVYGVSTEGARGQTDMGRETFVALRTVSET
jgi:hypothetical protein